MPWKQWAYLEKVSSSDFQQYLQNQTVPQFTNVAQRDAVYTPAPPPKGALCITLDTLTQWVWTASQWVQAPWNLPWGLVAPPVVVTVGQAGIGNAVTLITGSPITFQAVTGRRYRIAFHINYSFSGAGDALISLRDGTGAAEKARARSTPNAGSQVIELLHYESGLAAGPTTRQLHAQTTSTGVLGTGNGGLAGGPCVVFAIADDGPSGPPAATLLPGPENQPEIQPLEVAQ